MQLEVFREQFPEFKNLGDSMVQAFLDAAALEVDADVWGTKEDQGIGYLAAHKMALSPYGQTARLGGKDSSTYKAHYEDLVRQVGCGWLKAGGLITT